MSALDLSPHRTRQRPIILTGWLVLGVSVGVYLAVGLALGQPFHVGPRALAFFDLGIYRGAALRVVHGVALYGAPIHGVLGYTYPPFAAAVMAPLAGASRSLDAVLVTALNVTLLVWLMRRTLSLGGVAAGWPLAALLAGGALWLEPVSVTLGYGQVNLLIAALVVGDLSGPADARASGVGVGLAAAIKLTPLLFVPYLFLCGRRRSALVAGAVFLASIAASYVLLPADAARYWGGRLFLDASRVGGGADTANQSLRGAIARLGLAPGFGAELVVVAVGLCGLAVAVRYGRRGDRAAGFALTAVTALLVSPISWTHHWTLAVPGVVLLGCRAYQRRSRALTVVTCALTALGCAFVPELAGAAVHVRNLSTLVTSDPYVLAGLAALIVAGVRRLPQAPVGVAGA